MLRIGVLIAAGSWVPLFVVGTLDPTSNPVGLGLLAWLGSLIGVCVAAIGVLLAVVRFFWQTPQS